MALARGSYLVRNRLGLHARAATKLATLASRFPCEVSISRDGQAANAKSVMGVLLLCCAKGTQLIIEADGEQADLAVQEIGKLINGGFDEWE